MKIKAICCLGLLLMVGSIVTAQNVGPCLGYSTKAVVDWPQFQFDPCHTGYNPNESVLSPATVGNLVLDWRYLTGGGVDSSPAVVDGVLYVGSGDSNVYAVNAVTGAPLWKYATGGGVESSPAVASGVVYAGIP